CCPRCPSRSLDEFEAPPGACRGWCQRSPSASASTRNSRAPSVSGVATHDDPATSVTCSARPCSESPRPLPEVVVEVDYRHARGAGSPLQRRKAARHLLRFGHQGCRTFECEIVDVEHPTGRSPDT